MIGLKKSFVAAAGLAVLVAMVSSITPSPGFGQGPPAQRVLVVNAASQPVPIIGAVRVADSPRTPFDAQLQLTFAEGQKTTGDFFQSPPAGKQFVVTFASGFAHLSAATAASFRILKTNTGGSTVAVYELKPVLTGTISGFVGSEPLNIYLNPGEGLFGLISRDTTIGTDADLGLSVSGYLVDVP